MVEGRLQHGPLAFPLVNDVEGEPNSSGTLSFSIPTADSWRSKPYVAQPTFEWLSDFIEAQEPASTRRAEFYRGGVRCQSITFRNAFETGWGQDLRAALKQDSLVQELSNHYGCNPVFGSFEDVHALDQDTLEELALAA